MCNHKTNHPSAVKVAAASEPRSTDRSSADFVHVANDRRYAATAASINPHALVASDSRSERFASLRVCAAGIVVPTTGTSSVIDDACQRLRTRPSASTRHRSVGKSGIDEPMRAEASGIRPPERVPSLIGAAL